MIRTAGWRRSRSSASFRLPTARCWRAAPELRGIYALAQDRGSIFDLYERDELWLLQDSGIYALDKARILAGETPHATQYRTARGLTGSLRVNTCNYMAPGRQPVSGHTKRRQIAVPQAFCVLWEHPRPSPKSGKTCRSDTRPGDVGERAERSEE